MSLIGSFTNASIGNQSLPWLNMTAGNSTLNGPPLIYLPPEAPLEVVIITWMNKYIVALILCFALFGNLTAFSVFSMPPYRHSVTAVLYRVLAVVDTMAVVINDGFNTLPMAYARVTLMSYNTITCKLFAPLHIWSRAFSAWLLVIIGLERFIGILYPHLTKVIITKKRFGWLIFAIGLGLMSFWTPLFISTVHRVTNYPTGPSPMCVFSPGGTFDRYFMIFDYLSLLLTCALPFAFIIIFNIAIIYVLMKRRGQARNCSDNDSQANSAAAILIAVSLTFIILTMPYALYLILQKYFFMRGDQLSFRKTYTLRAYADLCDALNHSLNIVLYCFCGRKFRQCLWEMMRCGYLRRGSSINRTNNTTTRRAAISTITATGKDEEESITDLSAGAPP